MEHIQTMKDTFTSTDADGNEVPYFCDKFLIIKYLKMSDADLELNEKYNLGEELSKSLLEDYDESKIIDETFTMVVQVNGKVRGKIEVNANTSDDEMKELAKSIENVKNYIDGKEIVKEVIVPKKLVSIVVK